MKNDVMFVCVFILLIGNKLVGLLGMRDEDSNEDLFTRLDLEKEEDCPVRLKIALFENFSSGDSEVDQQVDWQSDRTVAEDDVDWRKAESVGDKDIVQVSSAGHQQTDVAGAAECRDDQSDASDILSRVEMNSSWLYSECSSLVAPPPVINSSSPCSSSSSTSSSKATSKRKWNRLAHVLRPVRLNKIRFLK